MRQIIGMEKREWGPDLTKIHYILYEILKQGGKEALSLMKAPLTLRRVVNQSSKNGNDSSLIVIDVICICVGASYQGRVFPSSCFTKSVYHELMVNLCTIVFPHLLL